MEDCDLEIANRRAGFKFRGQMEQIFGILKEREEMKKPTEHWENNKQKQDQRATGKNETKIGTRKRPAEIEAKGNKKTK